MYTDFTNVSKVYPPAQEWLERLDSCYIELKDLAREISGSQEAVEFNPARLDFVNERLNLIYTCSRNTTSSL